MWALLWLILPLVPAGATGGLPLAGIVLDPAGAPVSGVDVRLISAQQAVIAASASDDQGRFRFTGIPAGSYVLLATSRSFEPRRTPVVLRLRSHPELVLQLELRPLRDSVTVTAEAGTAADSSIAPQSVNIIGEEELRERIGAAVAQLASEEVGLHLQRTSPTIAGVFVRGLTGNKVNVFIDGVRYSNSAARGGINTFLGLIEPSSLEGVEVLRGPSSAQYGSDAIGGSLQFLSRLPRLASSNNREWHGSADAAYVSADQSGSSHLSLNYGGRTFAILGQAAGRRVSTLRTGRALDSHNAVTRFLGLPSGLVVGDRLPDTAFTQYAGTLKVNWSPSAYSQWILHYSRSQTDGGKRYDQLIGGDGNLVADLRNLMLDLAYLKYSRFELGPLDQVTLAYSLNFQREERVNQGGNGNPRATISHDREKMRAHGFQALARKFWKGRHETIGGADYYYERISAPSFGVDPVRQTASVRRPRIPDRARYTSGGIYLQSSTEAARGRLRLTGSLRYGSASYLSRAAWSPPAPGGPLWPDDSLRVSDLTGRAGALVLLAGGFSTFASASRGFRAPHMTDLGTFGLTGAGYEVAAPDIAGMGGLVGTTAGPDAVSSGRSVEQVRSETSMSYEAGIRFRNGDIAADLTLFLNTVRDGITKQALILPQGAVGKNLAGETIVAQGANGVVYVAASSSPVLVRANYGDARIRGLEQTLDWRLHAKLNLGAILTVQRAWDTATGLPPAIEGGTPAPDAYLKLRYSPVGSRVFLEPYAHAAARQSRLSSLDLEDRRTGAARSRSSIRSFFYNGATARGLVSPGPDTRPGTSDDFLNVTGETLGRIQDRVLGAGVPGAPLFSAVPGYVVFGVRAGLKLGERQDMLLDFSNIGDRNYRGMSWGIDAPGRSLALRYRVTW